MFSRHFCGRTIWSSNHAHSQLLGFSRGDNKFWFLTSGCKYQSWFFASLCKCWSHLRLLRVLCKFLIFLTRLFSISCALFGLITLFGFRSRRRWRCLENLRPITSSSGWFHIRFGYTLTQRGDRLVRDLGIELKLRHPRNLVLWWLYRSLRWTFGLQSRFYLPLDFFVLSKSFRHIFTLSHPFFLGTTIKVWFVKLFWLIYGTIKYFIEILDVSTNVSGSDWNILIHTCF